MRNSSNPITGHERRPRSTGLRTSLGAPAFGLDSASSMVDSTELRKRLATSGNPCSTYQPNCRTMSASDRGQKDELHGFALHAAYFSAIFSVFAFRLFQYSSSIGMESPDANPSSNSASNRASASRSCASRNRLRKYSLMSPYPLLATWASTNCLRDSGNEMVTVVMAGPYFVSAPNWRSFYLITIEKKLNRPRAAQHAARKAFD